MVLQLDVDGLTTPHSNKKQAYYTLFYTASDNMTGSVQDVVLKGVFVLRGRKLQEAEESYSLTSFIICSLRQILD
jgi:hypothetical protein